ncbi:putative mannose-6-phosphate class i [Erysiphe necator]|uniref:Mannose-6-phosphate isomerase n=1 Tax=Uncinula necator TaxID=52586 RepID=A0A0B1P7V5_UNCNE|nr:putative mannose-6-phosphate class i [Erysiphe necator]
MHRETRHTNMPPTLIRLECGVNNYNWGKIGSGSVAALFAAATPSDDFTIQEDLPYSELWMGTHLSNPSKDLHSKRTLLDIIKNNQALISAEIYSKFGAKLPFLFKVISIEKALSIQAHPNKKLAKILHKKDPNNYPDDNHKPEMTIALTPFEGLCGFRPLCEISHFLSTVPSLKSLIGTIQAEEFQAATGNNELQDTPEKKYMNKKSLQKVFQALMNAKPEDVELKSKELVKDALESGKNFAGGIKGDFSNTPQEMAELVIRLNDQFPGDIGLFVLFFLNYVKLDVGEAMFLKANDIHAYLSGDIIECMAASDNVVRAGFTPKFKDVKTLTEMLTYSYAPIEEQKLKPVDYPYVILNSTAYSSGSSSVLYDASIEEFSVVKTELKRKGSKATFERIAGPSIIICTSGSGKITVGSKSEEVRAGYVFFLAAFSDIVFESNGQEYTTFKAFCEA